MKYAPLWLVLTLTASQAIANQDAYDWIEKLSKNTSSCASEIERKAKEAYNSQSCRLAINQIRENRTEIFAGAMALYGQYRNDLNNRHEVAVGMWPGLVKTWEALERIRAADGKGEIGELVTTAEKFVIAGESLAQTSDKNVIADIQTHLNRLGYDAGTPDGIMGDKTRNAIKKIQSSYGVTIDGVASEELLRSLKLL